MKRLTTFACFALALTFAVGAFAGDRSFENLDRASQSYIDFGRPAAKALGDTVDLMGPYKLNPGLNYFAGDFQTPTQTARPGGTGVLGGGWTGVDETHQPNYFHLDTYHNPFTGNAAWCGDIGIVPCDETDVAGGYLGNWNSVLEFRKTVGVGVATDVRVQADMQYDSEPEYDYTYLVRRTEANPDFEPIAAPGQGQSWDGVGVTAVDYLFSYTPAELLGGDEICVAFMFQSDGGADDGDCYYPSDGAVRLDNITVTVTVGGGTPTVYNDDFDTEGSGIGPAFNWNNPEFPWVGDFARVWNQLGDADCLHRRRPRDSRTPRDRGPRRRRLRPSGWLHRE
jgi:hypothetical protein